MIMNYKNYITNYKLMSLAFATKKKREMIEQI